jgi:hypothetical protein
MSSAVKEFLSTGNTGLDVLADAIAERVIARMEAGQPDRLLTVEEAAKYLGRSARGSALDRRRHPPGCSGGTVCPP